MTERPYDVPVRRDQVLYPCLRAPPPAPLAVSGAGSGNLDRFYGVQTLEPRILQPPVHPDTPPTLLVHRIAPIRFGYSFGAASIIILAISRPQGQPVAFPYTSARSAALLKTWITPPKILGRMFFQIGSFGLEASANSLRSSKRDSASDKSDNSFSASGFGSFLASLILHL